MALSCIILEIKLDIGRKSWFFHTPLDSPPSLRGPRRNIAVPFGTQKLEWWGYPMVKTNFEDMYNRLDRISACDRQTDKRTDGRTDILPWHSSHYAYASRVKNRGNDNDTAMVTELQQELICCLSNRATYNDLEWPLTQISRSRHYLTQNVSETVQQSHSYNRLLISTCTCLTQECHFELEWHSVERIHLRQSCSDGSRWIKPFLNHAPLQRRVDNSYTWDFPDVIKFGVAALIRYRRKQSGSDIRTIIRIGLKS